MTNPDNQYYNQPSRSISPFAEHDTKNLNSSSLSIKPIDSSTRTRNEEHEPQYQCWKRTRNNPNEKEDDQEAKVMKVLIAMIIQPPDEEDIVHVMVAISNTYRLDSQIKDKIASNLTLLLADIREH
jgi:hypothetical protein